MSDNMLKAALKESAALEVLLLQDPTFAKWKSVQALIATYRATEAKEAKAVAPTVPEEIVKPATGAVQGSAIATAVSKTSGEPVLSNPQMIVQAAKVFLKQRGHRAKSKVITKAIQDRGIEIKGQDPVATVAAHLSNAKSDFSNVKGEGYGLREWDVAAPSVVTIDFNGADQQPH